MKSNRWFWVVLPVVFVASFWATAGFWATIKPEKAAPQRSRDLESQGVWSGATTGVGTAWASTVTGALTAIPVPTYPATRTWQISEVLWVTETAGACIYMSQISGPSYGWAVSAMPKTQLAPGIGCQ